MDESSTPTDDTVVHRSSRDRDEIAGRLLPWLAARLPGDADPEITGIETSEANGMSSDTVLFSATWSDADGRHDRGLVVRIGPHPDDVPVHPRYDLGEQFETMRAVADHSSVPVPRPLWLDEDPSLFGSPFFVMERIDGRIPPDVLPYTFGDNWLFDASPAEQRRLQESTIDAIGALHAIEEPTTRFAFLPPAGPGDTPLRQHVAYTEAWYRWAAETTGPSATIERALRWIDDNWPSSIERETVLSWGDSRIGNILYDGFEPAGVLDWEMAHLGPRELDLGWLLYSHRVFDDLAVELGQPGMPRFLHRDDVATHYEKVTGHEPRDLDFSITYAATIWAIIFLRTGTRAIRFGERGPADDADELLMNRTYLGELLDGTYWSNRA